MLSWIVYGAIILVIASIIVGGGYLVWIGWTVTGWIAIVLGVCIAALFTLGLMALNVQ